MWLQIADENRDFLKRIQKWRVLKRIVVTNASVLVRTSETPEKFKNADAVFLRFSVDIPGETASANTVPFEMKTHHLYYNKSLPSLSCTLQNLFHSHKNCCTSTVFPKSKKYFASFRGSFAEIQLDVTPVFASEG